MWHVVLNSTTNQSHNNKETRPASEFVEQIQSCIDTRSISSNYYATLQLLIWLPQNVMRILLLLSSWLPCCSAVRPKCKFYQQGFIQFSFLLSEKCGPISIMIFSLSQCPCTIQLGPWNTREDVMGRQSSGQYERTGMKVEKQRKCKTQKTKRSLLNSTYVVALLVWSIDYYFNQLNKMSVRAKTVNKKRENTENQWILLHVTEKERHQVDIRVWHQCIFLIYPNNGDLNSEWFP